jgi:hypothetical protein
MKVLVKLIIVFVLIIPLACKKTDLSVALPTNPTSEGAFPKNAFWSSVSNYTNKVPTVYISTKGNTIVNEPKVQSIIQIQLGDTIVFRSNIGIEYRGSTSFRLFDQKSYGFELRDVADNDTDSAIMDFPIQSDFILYAPANDKSLIRNTLIYDLSNQIGMYASRTKFVQLYIDGSYLGLYVLMEKMKRDKARINITKMGINDNDASQVTGGYIIKIDKSAGDNSIVGWEADAIYTEALSFRSLYDPNGNKILYTPYGPKKGAETYYMYEYPKFDAITDAQKKYLQTYINDFENTLLSNNFSNATTGYSKYIDENSFIDFLILNEFAYNPDAYRLSTFMNMDRSGKLKMGPIWDFNLGFGNDDRTAFTNASTWMFNFNNYYPGDSWLINFWWKKLLADPTFVTKLKTRWTSYRTTVLSEQNITNTIEKQIAILKINNSIDKHFERWKILGVKLPYNNFVGKTHQEELDFLKSWISKRLLWMDTEMVKL